MIPCISQVTTLPSSFEADVTDYSSAGCAAMELWLTKLEAFLERHTVEEAKRLSAAHEIRFAAASVQGGILWAEGESGRESFALLERRLSLCQALRIPTLVVAADFVSDLSATSFQRAVASLQQASLTAAPFGVRLALEFQARARFCNNLHTAISLAAAAEDPNVGICFDAFHYYTGPSKFEDVKHLAKENLFHVQLSDLAGVPRELATDSDRILPGDGDFELLPIVDWLRTIGYDGYVSVELMNPRLWNLQGAQVAEVSITALRKLLSLAGC
jgi:4-hydroxyphenylpyruvate dioxygenase